MNTKTASALKELVMGVTEGVTEGVTVVVSVEGNRLPAKDLGLLLCICVARGG